MKRRCGAWLPAFGFVVGSFFVDSSWRRFGPCFLYAHLTNQYDYLCDGWLGRPSMCTASPLVRSPGYRRRRVSVYGEGRRGPPWSVGRRSLFIGYGIDTYNTGLPGDMASSGDVTGTGLCASTVLKIILSPSSSLFSCSSPPFYLFSCSSLLVSCSFHLYPHVCSPAWTGWPMSSDCCQGAGTSLRRWAEIAML